MVARTSLVELYSTMTCSNRSGCRVGDGPNVTLCLQPLLARRNTAGGGRDALFFPERISAGKTSHRAWGTSSSRDGWRPGVGLT